MKLKTLLINLAIVGVGLALAPAQAGDNQYGQGGWELVKVKGGGDDRGQRKDDDRRNRGEQDLGGSDANYGNATGYNQHGIPSDYKAGNFKERLYLQRKREREEKEKAETENQ